MNNINYERQYHALYSKLVNQGVWVENERTGERCLTIIGHTMKYDSGSVSVPLMSTKRSFPQTAVAEIIGYLRGYTNAESFNTIGCPTWFKNANETKAWLSNPNRKYDNHMGKVYGAVDGAKEALLKINDNLSKGIDDRGETYTFWKPEQFDQGCLRPCMRTHTFSLLGDTLYLTSESRSVDVALGLNFNSIQCDFLLKLMAKIHGYKVGYCTHNMINVHIYEKHLPELMRQMSKPLIPIHASLEIKDNVKSLDDIIGNHKHAREFIDVTYDSEAMEKINFEMTA